MYKKKILNLTILMNKNCIERLYIDIKYKIVQSMKFTSSKYSILKIEESFEFLVIFEFLFDLVSYPWSLKNGYVGGEM